MGECGTYVTPSTKYKILDSSMPLTSDTFSSLPWLNSWYHSYDPIKVLSEREGEAGGERRAKEGERE